ncbi:hypothetical protein FQN50_003687 [Emmonsiellopsis sp. PD_5]|nr:hypothetical protein FQN50_003687 [Emmonsiellopsis sp. PD_5]
MASLPQQQSSAARQRPSGDQTSYNASSSASETETPATQTENSLLQSGSGQSSEQSDSFRDLSWPESHSSSQSQSQQQPATMEADNTPSTTTTAIQPTTTTTSSPPPTDPDPEPRKCWICYTDETEDTPLNTEWRSPCPCALTAHEACLLDWLADLENPSSRKRTSSGRPAKMHCPQCKSEIVISRPRSLVVDLVRAVERLAGKLVLPGMVFTLAGTVWAGCCAHGVYSTYFVFGAEDAQRIFAGRGESGASSASSWNPRLNFGLPLIPIVLILSRTKYAEGLLPAIPVLFFATQQSGSPELEVDLWPPSAAMTFAALPYAKSVYGVLYEKLFGKLERRWIAEVRPRAGEESAEDVAQQQGGGGNQAVVQGPGGGGIDGGDFLMEFDLELQVGLGGGDDDEDDDAADDLAAIHAGIHQQPLPGGGPQVDAVGAENNAAAAAAAAAEGNNNQILGRRQEGIIHDTNNLADTFLGALLFPAISASMGGVLKMALPKSWTTPPPSSSSISVLEKGKAAGLLQSRWGRSVVGGCLFVLLKDALVLYCRWKLAKTHRKRKVLNYEGGRERGRGRGRERAGERRG